MVKMDPTKDAKDLDQNTWTLVHASDHKNINMHDPYFYVELPYGDLRPRLAFEKDTGGGNYSRLRAITQETNPKIKRKHMVWRLLQIMQ